MADLYISEETADDIETAAVDAALDGRSSSFARASG